MLHVAQDSATNCPIAPITRLPLDMPHPLDGIRLKLDRAQTHLESIRELLRPVQTGHYHLAREQCEEPHLVNLRFILPDADRTLSTVIGDCLHNLRSALDHLVWQLVLTNPPKRPSRKNQFPICKTADGWIEALSRDRLRGVVPKAIPLIWGLQPYVMTPIDPVSHPLWILNELTNIDKHRTLTVTTSAVMNPEVAFGRGLPWNEGGFKMTGLQAFLNGDIIGKLVARQVPPEPDLQAHGTLSVVFQDPPATRREIASELETILTFLRDDVVPTFEPFF